MNHSCSLEAIQRKVEIILNKYVPALDSTEKISDYLVHLSLRDIKFNISLSGVLGAIALAKQMQLARD